jgi:hypothetical protein
MEKNYTKEGIKSLGIALVYISGAFVIAGQAFNLFADGYSGGGDLLTMGGLGLTTAVIVFFVLVFKEKRA